VLGYRPRDAGPQLSYELGEKVEQGGQQGKRDNKNVGRPSLRMERETGDEGCKRGNLRKKIPPK